MSFSGLQIASLGSGSGGNSTLISSATTTLLLDCGFTLKETVARCEKLGISASRIDGILISHEHGDHVRASPFRHHMMLQNPVSTCLAVMVHASPVSLIWGYRHHTLSRKFPLVKLCW